LERQSINFIYLYHIDGDVNKENNDTAKQDNWSVSQQWIIVFFIEGDSFEAHFSFVYFRPVGSIF
jgi:hypothetical protein